MTAANFIAYAAQVAIVVALCAGLPRVLGLRAPGVQYVFWRLVLAVCLALPLLQPWRSLELRALADTGAPTLRSAEYVHVRAGGDPAPPPPAPFDWRLALQIVLAGGAGARLAWMTLGVARLNALRRRSAGSPALGFDDLQSAIGTRAPVLWSADVRHPVTFGLLRPVVLLPAALKSVDHAAQRAVVAHELHHVKRRDWGWVIGEEIVRSIFWFHPAMWWLISRVQLARETVVDELSILVTNARRTYLDTLLAFADDTGLSSSPAFSARRHLFHRVMLLSKEGGMSSSRIAVVSGALIAALGAGTWSAVNAFPLYDEGVPVAAAAAPADAAPQAQAQPRVQRPPRDPLSPATYHRLAVEYWDRAYKDLSLTPEARLDLVKKGLAEEDRALELNPDYVEALVYKNILLRMQANLSVDPQEQAALITQANELRDRAIELRKARGIPEPGAKGTLPPPPPPPPPPSAVAASMEFQQALERYRPIRIGGGVKTPTKIRDVKPEYPPIAQSARVQGVVIIEAIIDDAGQVAAARVLRSIPLLDQAALAAVEQWAFTPTLLNGVPSPVLMTVTVNFLLE
jgi:TonB family protein